MKTLSAGLIIGSLLLFGSGSARAAATLKAVAVDGDKVEIQLSGHAEYKTMTLPSKLVVDLLDTNVGSAAKTVDGKGEYLLKARAAQFQSKPEMVTRVVIELKSAVKNKIDRAGDNLVIVLNPDAKPAAKAAAPAAAAIPAVVRVQAPPAPAAAPEAAAALAAMVAGAVPAMPAPAPAPAPAVPAVVPPAVTLLGIEAGPDVVGLRLSGAVDYKTKYLADPARLEITLASTGSQMTENSVPGMGNFLKKVTSQQVGSGATASTKVLVYLQKPVSYSIDKQKGFLKILLNP